MHYKLFKSILTWSFSPIVIKIERVEHIIKLVLSIIYTLYVCPTLCTVVLDLFFACRQKEDYKLTTKKYQSLFIKSSVAFSHGMFYFFYITFQILKRTIGLSKFLLEHLNINVNLKTNLNFFHTF